MDADAGDFAGGVKTRHYLFRPLLHRDDNAPESVGGNAAHSIVGRGLHGDRRLCRIDVQVGGINAIGLQEAAHYAAKTSKAGNNNRIIFFLNFILRCKILSP